MPLSQFYNDDITIHHRNEIYTYRVSFQDGKAIGPFEMVAEEDDLLVRGCTNERFIVTKVVRNKGFAGMSAALDSCKIEFISEKRYLKSRESHGRYNIVQNIGTAQAVAGRDIQGGVHASITITQLLDALEQAVNKSENIPEDEKPGILTRIRSLASNPFVLAIAPQIVAESLKKVLGG